MEWPRVSVTQVSSDPLQAFVVSRASFKPSKPLLRIPELRLQCGSRKGFQNAASFRFIQEKTIPRASKYYSFRFPPPTNTTSGPLECMTAKRENVGYIQTHVVVIFFLYAQMLGP